MSEDAAAYRVLARKYRPASFAGLIGQDALVRTLSNAIAMDRLAHAYLLTGVRGVGKTSTARIVARAPSTASVRTGPAARRRSRAGRAITASPSPRIAMSM